MTSAITWQRPQSRQYTRFCAVTRYEGGASISACGGRWTTSSTYVLIGVDVGKLECSACRSLLDVHRALAELRSAPAIRTAELHTAPRGCHDIGCDRGYHATGLHMSRTWDSFNCTEIIDEWSEPAPRDGVLFEAEWDRSDIGEEP